MMGSAVRDLLWAKARGNLFVTKEAFLASLDGWQIETWDEGGQMALVTLKKGPEFHFISTGVVAIPRRLVRQVLQSQFDQHGYVITRTPKHEARQHRFNRIIGFVKTGEDEFDIHYRMDSIRRPHLKLEA